MDSVWVSGQSKLEIHLASASADAVMEKDHSNVRRGDEGNHLALVSEWREWERNLALEQEQWRCWTLLGELESYMFWVWFLGGLKLFLYGSSVKLEQKIWSQKREEKTFK